MEFMSQGTLYDFLFKTDKPLSQHLLLKIALNVADALRALHSRKPPIIHRDIKSPNIMMVGFEPRSDVVCKVTDFGESRTVAAEIIGRENLGNPLWLAPEIIKDTAEYTVSADIFSLGIVIGAELIGRKPPYSEHAVAQGQFLWKFEDEILKGLRPTIPPKTDPELASLVEQCWDGEPTKRPSADAVVHILRGMIASTLRAKFSHKT